MLYLYSFLAYVFITFICAAGWHLVAFKKIYDRLGAFTREEPIIPLGVASIVLQGLVVAYAFPLFLRDGNAIVQGVVFGLLSVGIFMGSSAVLAEAGKNEVGPLSTWIPLETAYYLVQGIAVGLALGLIYA